MSRTRISASEWRRIFQEQRASGQTVAAFCRQARIPQSSFYAWQRRLRKATGFVEVKLASNDLPRLAEARRIVPGTETMKRLVRSRASANIAGGPTNNSAASAIELHLPGDRCVVVRPGFDRRTLLDLLAALSSADAADVDCAAEAASSNSFTCATPDTGTGNTTHRHRLRRREFSA